MYQYLHQATGSWSCTRITINVLKSMTVLRALEDLCFVSTAHLSHSSASAMTGSASNSVPGVTVLSDTSGQPRTYPRRDESGGVSKLKCSALKAGPLKAMLTWADDAQNYLRNSTQRSNSMSCPHETSELRLTSHCWSVVTGVDLLLES
jgi:hypothetical protein